MLSIAINQNPFISLPQFNLGKIWRWLKVNNPVRPEENKAVIVCAIMDDGDRVPDGYVFKVPDGRLFYASVGEASSELKLNSIEQINDPHPDITKKLDYTNRFVNVQPFDKMGLGYEAQPINDTTITKWVVKAYYGNGKRAADVLAKLSLA